jgi:hypothetical protein
MDPPGFSPQDALYLRQQQQQQQQQQRGARWSDVSERSSSVDNSDIPSVIVMGKQQRVEPLGEFPSDHVSSGSSEGGGTTRRRRNRKGAVFSLMKGFLPSVAEGGRRRR